MMTDDSVSYQFAAVKQHRDNRHEIIYQLQIRQQPKQSRMCGIGEKADRRPIDPPPIIQLKVVYPAGGTQDKKAYLQNPYYFMYASLMAADSDEEIHLLRDGKTRSTTGSVVSSLYHLKDIDNSDAGFFVFPDLSVRMEGNYRLKLSLFEIIGKEVYHCKSIFSEMFIVYSAKRFPGMEESTFLSRSFADQGLKIRIRKEIRIRRRLSKRKEIEAPPEPDAVLKSKRARKQRGGEGGEESDGSSEHEGSEATLDDKRRFDQHSTLSHERDAGAISSSPFNEFSIGTAGPPASIRRSIDGPPQQQQPQQQQQRFPSNPVVGGPGYPYDNTMAPPTQYGAGSYPHQARWDDADPSRGYPGYNAALPDRRYPVQQQVGAYQQYGQPYPNQETHPYQQYPGTTGRRLSDQQQRPYNEQDARVKNEQASAAATGQNQWYRAGNPPPPPGTGRGSYYQQPNQSFDDGQSRAAAGQYGVNRGEYYAAPTGDGPFNVPQGQQYDGYNAASGYNAAGRQGYDQYQTPASGPAGPYGNYGTPIRPTQYAQAEYNAAVRPTGGNFTRNMMGGAPTMDDQRQQQQLPSPSTRVAGTNEQWFPGTSGQGGGNYMIPSTGTQPSPQQTSSQQGGARYANYADNTRR